MSGCSSDRGSRSVRTSSRCRCATSRRHRRALALSALSAAVAAAAPLTARAADTVTYTGPAAGGSWDSTGLGSTAWLNTTTSAPLNVPPPGTVALLGQNAAGGTGFATVNFNSAYSTAAPLVGVTIDARNTLSQTNAATSMVVAGNQVVGNLTTGAYVHTAGSNMLAGATSGLYLGFSTAATGTYSLDGTGTLNVEGGEFVGYGGTGAFSQVNGTHAISGTTGLNVGYLAGSSGNFLLAGGSLSSAANEYVGYSGNGLLTQTGGVFTQFFNTSLSSFWIGFNAGASGTVNLSGGVLNASNDIVAGYDGQATFNQTGGFNNASGLTLGFNVTGTGTYALSGGRLDVSADTFVGSAGAGTFTQSGSAIATTTNLYLGLSAGSSGTYSLSGDSKLTVAGSEVVGYGGAGLFNQTGGSHSIAGTLFTAYTNGASGTFNLSGGTLSASDVVNDGAYLQTGGVATLGNVSGTGTTSIGGGAGTALASVRSLSLASLAINSAGTVQVRTSTARATSSITALTIGPNGLLDLGNSPLLLDNTATPEPAVRQYLKNGYNPEPVSGIGNWTGRGGITSSDAIASHGPGGSFKVSVGYVNGAYAGDPLIGGSIPGQGSLPTNRILVRPALYGDLNLDGRVDDTDLAILSGLGQYNQPTDKFGWLGGDLNHDGKVDDTDLQILSGAGNYNGPSYGTSAAASSASATPSLTGHVDVNGDIVLSATTSQGTAGDGVLDFVYNPQTGHLTLSYDGDPRVTSAQPFQVVRLKSAGGHFVPENFNQTAFGAGVTATTSALNGTASGSNSVPDGYDLGGVLPAGLTIADLTPDLTLQWNVFGGGLTLKNGDIVVPEPATPAVIAAAALLGISRRRRSKRDARLNERSVP